MLIYFSKNKCKIVPAEVNEYCFLLYPWKSWFYTTDSGRESAKQAAAVLSSIYDVKVTFIPSFGILTIQ